MPVPSEAFAAVYEDQNRLGVIVARIGRGGFEFCVPPIYPCRYFAVSSGLIDFGDLRPFCRSRSAAGFST
jgi:hypothetical protein